MRGPAGATAGNPPPRRPTRRGRGAAMGHGTSKGKKRRPAGLGGSITLGSGGKLWGTRGLRSGPRDPRSGRGGGGPQGLWSGGKPRGGAATEWVGGRIVSGRLDPPRRGRGGQIISGRLDPQRKGRGSRVVAGRLDFKRNGRGSRVITGQLDPQRGRGNQGRQNSGSLHSVPLSTGGGRTGVGGRGRKPAHRPSNQGARARWRQWHGANRWDGVAG